eukprot:Platyproteum_vivax@DN7156_c0_g1_i1.p1
MGLPIYAVVAGCSTASDKEGRSVPAPGRGILSTCKEVAGPPDATLSITYRREQLDEEVEFLQAEAEKAISDNPKREKAIRTLLTSRVAASRRFWSGGCWKHSPYVAPLRRMLSTYGLNISDLAVVSMHGTSTVLNDQNESSVLQTQLSHLGHNSQVLTIWQKWLTGHPKGPAAGWMMNGLIQAMLTGTVPGQRNGDNPDSKLKCNNKLLYINETIRLGSPLKAGMLHSFGFGQANAEVVVVHPNYILAAVEPEALVQYRKMRKVRNHRATQYLQRSLTSVHAFINIKNDAPWPSECTDTVMTNPLARATFQEAKGEWIIDHTAASATPGDGSEELERNVTAMMSSLATEQSLSGTSEKNYYGIDVEPFRTFSQKPQSFFERNFTPNEVMYCNASPNPVRAFAGRWVVKEAVIKALTAFAVSFSSFDVKKALGGPDAALRDIEVLTHPSGLPTLALHGHPNSVAKELGINTTKLPLQVSISYSSDHAVGLVVLNK